MVDPLVIAGGAAAAYLLLKPKEMTPEEAQETVNNMPQEELENQVPPTVTVAAAPPIVELVPEPIIVEPDPEPTIVEPELAPIVVEPEPSPIVVEPVPEPKTCVLVKSPPERKIPKPPQIDKYNRKSKELTLRLVAELEAADTRFSKALKGLPLPDARAIIAQAPPPQEPSGAFASRMIARHIGGMGHLGSSKIWSVQRLQQTQLQMQQQQLEQQQQAARAGFLVDQILRQVPQVSREQAEWSRKKLGLSIAQIGRAVLAFDAETNAANVKAHEEGTQLEQEVRPYKAAWETTNRMVAMEAIVEFQVRLQEYEGRGWKIHRVNIQVMPGLPKEGTQVGSEEAAASVIEAAYATKEERLLGFRSVVYACPPGVEPEVLAF